MKASDIKVSMDFRIIRATDQQERWIQIEGEFLANAEKRICKFNGIVRDITKEKPNGRETTA